MRRSWSRNSLSIQLYPPQFPPQLPMVGNGAADQSPEIRRVVQFLQMAKLMHDNIIGKMRWQRCHPIIKIQILLLRTAPPPRPLIPNRNPIKRKIVPDIQFPNPGMNKFTRMFAMMARDHYRLNSFKPFLITASLTSKPFIEIIFSE